MNRTDDDLTALRSFRAELADPGESRLASIRARIDAGTGTDTGTDAAREAGRPVPAGKRPRFSVPTLVATAATLAVVAGAAVVGIVDRSGDGAATQPPAPSASAEHLATVDLLLRLADRAATGPAPLSVADGQLLYVRNDATSSGVTGTGPWVHELWLDPDAFFLTVMSRRTQDGQVTVMPDPADPTADFEESFQEQLAAREAAGPSMRWPNAAFLATLPADPDALLTMLIEASQTPGGGRTTEQAVIGLLSEIMPHAEPMITPQVRAALYHALARLPGLTSSGETMEIGGRLVHAVGEDDHEFASDLLIDADTGRFVGTRDLDPAEPNVSHTVLWTTAVVANPGDTP